jgi:hypothetical protein
LPWLGLSVGCRKAQKVQLEALSKFQGASRVANDLPFAKSTQAFAPGAASPAMEAIGLKREIQETCSCNENFGEFTFRASRSDDDKNEPRDQYIVFLFLPYVEKDKVALARSPAAKIESAPLHYPFHAIFRNTRVKSVLFQTEGARNSSALKRAIETGVAIFLSGRKNEAIN